MLVASVLLVLLVMAIVGWVLCLRQKKREIEHLRNENALLTGAIRTVNGKHTKSH